MVGITLTSAEAISIVRKRCKSVTRRMAKCPYEIGSKSVARVDSEGKILPYAELTIKTVRVIKLKDITLEMAKADGFSSVEGMKLNLVKLYGSVEDEAELTRIGFDVDKMLTEKEKEKSNAGESPFDSIDA